MGSINGWKARNKQDDKINFTIRLGIVTFIEIKWDFSSKKGRFMLLNFGYEKA